MNSKAKNIPLWFLAELTYRCPQQCPYCSNPLNYSSSFANELSTAEWKKVLAEGRKLGATQLGFSGGEPCVRQDLEELVGHARQLGYYTNLITSGMGLTVDRVTQLRNVGMDHIQLSFEASEEKLNNELAGCDSFQHKLEIAKAIKQQGFPMVLNIVLHRRNIDFIEEILHFAKLLQADYVELANTQYYGWALANRESLLPTKKQLVDAERVTNLFREQHAGDMKVYFVVPDYYENRPKRCSNGWGTTFISVTPDGYVLPCQSAQVLPGLEFPNVKSHSLEWIWHDSPLFNQYRGTDWMTEPCRSCDEKLQDLGGCRCQAYLLAGDATKADPICDKSPEHQKVVLITAAQNISPAIKPLIFRNPQNAAKVSNNVD